MSNNNINLAGGLGNLPDSPPDANSIVEHHQFTPTESAPISNQTGPPRRSSLPGTSSRGVFSNGTRFSVIHPSPLQDSSSGSHPNATVLSQVYESPVHPSVSQDGQTNGIYSNRTGNTPRGESVSRDTGSGTSHHSSYRSHHDPVVPTALDVFDKVVGLPGDEHRSTEQLATVLVAMETNNPNIIDPPLPVGLWSWVRKPRFTIQLREDIQKFIQSSQVSTLGHTTDTDVELFKKMKVLQLSSDFAQKMSAQFKGEIKPHDVYATMREVVLKLKNKGIPAEAGCEQAMLIMKEAGFGTNELTAHTQSYDAFLSALLVSSGMESANWIRSSIFLTEPHDHTLSTRNVVAMFELNLKYQGWSEWCDEFKIALFMSKMEDPDSLLALSDLPAHPDVARVDPLRPFTGSRLNMSWANFKQWVSYTGAALFGRKQAGEWYQSPTPTRRHR